MATPPDPAAPPAVTRRPDGAAAPVPAAVDDGAASPAAVDDGAASPAATGARTFELTLENFSGPFDLLLSLIAKHRLDITEVALAQVTDEFIGHISAQSEWDLGQASEFLVIAATLLDLKAARLLPRGAVDDEDDLELLEARDLLFARLLQYRAFKDVADHLGQRWAQTAKTYPRSVALEPHLAALLPELIMQIGPEELARLAAGAFAPRPGAPQVDITHVHDPLVPVREQATLIVDRLRRLRSATFRALTADAASTAVVVARFLALLELFRERAVSFEQAEALGELTIRWSGAEEGEVAVDDEYDDAGFDDAAAQEDDDE
ncbi:segregation/condensation protein A [Georgenia yuyongxinii]|uniref:Segregation and condensation protein A n=1 Tax=Georgenia yuyongxinii TaxID=2589797 RepID=A0A552WNB3_9MICO|nr:segregation/condensation protein A [Georgenia yuyongxinii]